MGIIRRWVERRRKRRQISCYLEPDQVEFEEADPDAPGGIRRWLQDRPIVKLGKKLVTISEVLQLALLYGTDAVAIYETVADGVKTAPEGDALAPKVAHYAAVTEKVAARVKALAEKVKK